MKAAIVKEIGLLEVQNVPEPEPMADEIKVKIAYAGICGTDPIILEGTMGGEQKPAGAIGEYNKHNPKGDAIMGLEMRDGMRILGHEASGTIVKIGKDIKGNFRIGQHVAMNFKSTCGDCYYCTNGMANFCDNLAPLSGVMAEYAVFKENIVFPIPDDLPLDFGAFLEPVSIAVRTLDIARIKLGDSVIITGGGPIGLLILQLAIKSGASKVLLSEPIEEKRKLAKQLGANVVVDPLKENLLEISNKFTDNRGFDVCFEVSGIPAIARQLILLAGADGKIIWVATYPSNYNVEVPINYLHSREISIHTIIPSPYVFPRAVQLLPTLDLKPLITVYQLDDVGRAFEAHKKGKNVKIMLKP